MEKNEVNKFEAPPQQGQSVYKIDTDTSRTTPLVRKGLVLNYGGPTDIRVIWLYSRRGGEEEVYREVIDDIYPDPESAVAAFICKQQRCLAEQIVEIKAAN